jgi:acyl-CoA dehydrogenase
VTNVEGLVDATKKFVQARVVPLDDEHDGNIEAAGGDALRVELQAAARDAGLLAPHAPPDCGGLGLSMIERAPVFEAAGFSLFGPTALNVNAPDEGNMHLLDLVGTESQRRTFLDPLARGAVRSAFAMTEPAPGAGSDPARLTTRATKVDGGWIINGSKAFITGADGAGFFIIMARTTGEPGDLGGATMFLAAADTPGIKVGRHIRTIDRSMLGGHCEVEFTDAFASDDQILGAVDEGFRYAQVRLGPARMTHVMRWTGAALRAHETAIRYVSERPAFGGYLADQGMVHQMIADSEIDLAATRALLVTACRELDDGERGSMSTSIAKTFAAEALGRVVDRATQLCGGMGVSADLPIAKIARELRPFRIYDGPSEVHRRSIARRAISRAAKAVA